MHDHQERKDVQFSKNYRWPDGRYKNNDSINANSKSQCDVEFKSENRQKTHQTQKDEKLVSGNGIKNITFDTYF